MKFLKNNMLELKLSCSEYEVNSTMKILRFLRKGIAHTESGTECQDAAEYIQYAADLAVLAISDGASQARYARIGAECNVHAVLELFRQMSVEEFLAKTEAEQKQIILGQCLHEIKRKADNVQCYDLRQFSATLVFAVITKDLVFTGHLGDGAIYMTNAEHQSCFSSEPENIQVSYRTYFTVSKDAYEHLYLHTVKRDEFRPAMVVMMSDGPQLMFKDRGFGRPEETAEEMSPFLVTGQVTSDEDLGELLDAMTELESEKIDDWSVLAAVLEEQVCEQASTAPREEAVEEKGNVQEKTKEHEDLKEEQRETVQQKQGAEQDRQEKTPQQKVSQEKTSRENSVQGALPQKECREDSTEAAKQVIMVSETLHKHYRTKIEHLQVLEKFLKNNHRAYEIIKGIRKEKYAYEYIACNKTDYYDIELILIDRYLEEYPETDWKRRHDLITKRIRSNFAALKQDIQKQNKETALELLEVRIKNTDWVWMFLVIEKVAVVPESVQNSFSYRREPREVSFEESVYRKFAQMEKILKDLFSL